MEETKYIWQDGQMVEWAEAKTHVLSHSLHYGSAVFEGVRFYDTPRGPAVFRLKEHTERLLNSAKDLYMNVPYSYKEINRAILDVLRVNKVKSGYIRPIFFYGYGKMGLSVKGAPVSAVIAAWPWGSYLGDAPVRVKCSSFYRLCPKAFKMSAKVSGYYINSIFASEEAKRAGYDEALLTHCDGTVTEGPGENFFLVKDGVLMTPPLGMILPGITRDSILEIAKNFGIKVMEKEIKLEDVYGADEAFFTGTAAEVTPIASLDDKLFKEAPGLITAKLKAAYMEIVSGKNPQYENWLSYVD